MFKKILGIELVVVLVMSLVYSNLYSKTQIIRIYAPSYKILYSSIPLRTLDIAGGQPGQWFDVVISEDERWAVDASGLSYTVYIENLEKQKEQVMASYLSYTQYVDSLQTMASNYPSIASVGFFGPTYEGRDIYYIKISDNVNTDEQEPEVLFTALTHAREWASGLIVLKLADTLLANYSSDPFLRSLVDNREIFIVPVHNVDGYVYDYGNGGAWWRKNRQPFGGQIGTDLNRNFGGTYNKDIEGDWGVVDQGKATHNQGQEVFLGTAPMSGPANDVLVQFLETRPIVTGIHYHTYSELVLWPWGHNYTQTPHNSFFVSIGQAMASKIGRLGSGTYTPEQAVYLYPTSGSSIDWHYGYNTYKKGKPALMYTIEAGTQFYQPTSDLPELIRENLDGLLFLLDTAQYLESQMIGIVPEPQWDTRDTLPEDNLNIHWTAISPEWNNPTGWDVQELSGYSVSQEDFESTPTRWILTNFSRSTSRRYSGSYSLYAGNQNDLIAVAQTKHPYLVRSGDALSFWIWFNLETDWDVALVEVSPDARVWTPLDTRFTGSSGGWVQKTYSLNQWAGRSLFFRFRVLYDSYITEEGAYFDDVNIIPSFTDSSLVAVDVADTQVTLTGYAPGTYYFRVRGQNAGFGEGGWSEVKELVVESVYGIEEKLPISLKLGENKLQFFIKKGRRNAGVELYLPSRMHIRLILLDALGRVNKTLARGVFERGFIQKTIDVPSAGVYFFYLETSNKHFTEKWIVQ